MKIYLSFLILLLVLTSINGQIKVNRVEVYASESKQLKTIINLNKIYSYSRNNVIFSLNKPLSSTQEYNLHGCELLWHTHPNTHIIQYTNLDGGNYKLQIREILSKRNLLTYCFVIDAPFWKKGWFIISLFLYLLAVLGAILYLFMNYRLRQQLRLQSVRHELEIKALRAQMNPHFIFNCMNTIDAYILRKRFLEASDYLQKFSKLIRQILENSENQTISIEQELQALKLYIELEQERFSDSFSYEFDIEPALVQKNYQIPSLILQPFVENALLHGIRHLIGRKGHIILKLSTNDNDNRENPVLICSIEDNGIGRKASAKINENRQKSHKSMGVNVTMERIRTYQAIYGSSMETVISDRDEGTKVTIKLPLIII